MRIHHDGHVVAFNHKTFAIAFAYIIENQMNYIKWKKIKEKIKKEVENKKKEYNEREK